MSDDALYYSPFIAFKSFSDLDVCMTATEVVNGDASSHVSSRRYLGEEVASGSEAKGGTGSPASGKLSSGQVTGIMPVIGAEPPPRRRPARAH